MCFWTQSSQYLVSSDPNIWVFDGFLSDRVLNHINKVCDTTPVSEFHQKVLGNRSRLSHSWSFDRDEDTRELFEVIQSISGVSCLEQFESLLVTDVRGDSQVEHMDHISLDHLARRYEKLDFIDLAKQSESSTSAGFVVPTFSIAFYLNDVGGVHFPHALDLKGIQIEGKLGRIIMWQNYIDNERPLHNQVAQHYGVYDQDRPKRIVTMGVLANSTPAIDFIDHKVTVGIIYCPGMLDKSVRHDGCHVGGHLHTGGSSEPATRPPSPPKPDLVLTLIGALQDDTWKVSATNMAGDSVCDLKVKSFEKFSTIRTAIEQKINTPKQYTVKLVNPEGEIMNYSPQTPISEIFAFGASAVEGDLAEKLLMLISMGFPEADALSALQRCGGDLDRSVAELTNIVGDGGLEELASEEGRWRSGSLSKSLRVVGHEELASRVADLESKVEQLVDMGFHEDDARVALEQCGGNMQRSILSMGSRVDGDEDNKEKIRQLVDMGFPEADARSALEKCGGDLQRSLSSLLEQTIRI